MVHSINTWPMCTIVHGCAVGTTAVAAPPNAHGEKLGHSVRLYRWLRKLDAEVDSCQKIMVLRASQPWLLCPPWRVAAAIR
mmetsp:Transcript_124024/g.246988  ORF Transcript_124024/g.246988 Transcript_124024/m.246988 type:complete len:81 (-) Transcript_124024:812-1054(-)